MTAATACRTCGTELPPDSRFCNKCGAPITPAATSAEYKQVTVLSTRTPVAGMPHNSTRQTLLDRGADGDIDEAEAAIERLAAAPADEGLALRDIWLLRLRALLARAHNDDTAYLDYRDRYRDMAKTLGFEGHIAWAEAMP